MPYLMPPLDPPSVGSDHDRGTSPRDGILTATRGVHAPPEFEPGSGKAARRFSLIVLAAAAVLIAAVAGFNALVDPYGSVGTGVVGPAVWTDRVEKVRLIEQLTVPPRIVVLGSSRAMKVQPSFLTRITGLPAFNAAVSSGRPVDAYVFLRFLQDRYPDTSRSYLWLLDQESFADDTIDPTLLADATLSRYVPSATRWRGRADDLSWLLSWRTLRLSWRTLQEGRREPAPTDPSTEAEMQNGGSRPQFAADGYRVSDKHSRAAARGRALAKGIAQSRGIFEKRYRTGPAGLAGSPRVFFERCLRVMNTGGAVPVIVLSPVHPRLLQDLRPLGWSERHRQVRAYLRSLQASHRFVLLDMSRIESFDGVSRAFYDGVHMAPSNYRRLVRQVLVDPAAREALGGSRSAGPAAEAEPGGPSPRGL